MALSKILPASISQPNPTNLIINGNFVLNQRGASTVTSGYFLDRWTITSASATAHLSSSLPDGFSHGLSVSATSGNPIATQRIEAKNVSNLSGKVVTLSFYAKDLGNVGALYASLQTANSADNFGGTTTISEQTLTSDLPTSWTKYTCSWTIPASGLNGLQLNILCAGSSTFTMGIAGVCLNEGSHAISFSHESYGETLAKCQRYYYEHIRGVSGSRKYVGIGDFYTTTQLNCNISFPTTMRTSPTLVQGNGTDYFGWWGGSQAGDISATWNLFIPSENTTSMYLNPDDDPSASGIGARIYIKDDDSVSGTTNAFIALNAEL